LGFAQIIPIVVAATTVIAGCGTYLFQKRTDRREELIKIRRSEYRKWIQAIYDLTGDSESDTLKKFNQSTNDLFMFGSDRVVQAVGNFTHYMSITSPGGLPRDMKEAGNLLSRVVKEMRKDCFEVTELTETEIRNILPIQGMRDD
jgi:hypothetical protein